MLSFHANYGKFCNFLMHGTPPAFYKPSIAYSDNSYIFCWNRHYFLQLRIIHVALFFLPLLLLADQVDYIFFFFFFLRLLGPTRISIEFPKSTLFHYVCCKIIVQTRSLFVLNIDKWIGWNYSEEMKGNWTPNLHGLIRTSEPSFTERVLWNFTIEINDIA